jgi:peptidoglycan/LPS O-acetylase OafA/YrhL
LSRNRLPAIDGLRAVAALWVVLFHITALSHAQFPRVPGLDLFMRSGSTGVSLFLVLSGFCLFLPFAGGRAARFRSGEFFRRRFFRLAPAYYASLVLSLALAAIVAAPLGFPQLSFTDGLWQFGVHLAFLHSLFPDSFYALNGAYWSLGLEWQLYLTLPLIVLGVIRIGVARTVAIVFACNVAYRLGLGWAVDHSLLVDSGPLASFVLPNQLFGRWAEFGFGIIAAELYASGRLARFTRYQPAMIAAMLLLIPVAVSSTKFDVSHMVYGALFFVLVCTVLIPGNIVWRAMSWRPLVAIGTMSYSLYLIHQPIIQSVSGWFAVYQPSASPTVVFLWLLALLPAMLLVAWAFFMLVERRTLSSSTPSLSMPAFGRLLARLRLALQPSAQDVEARAATMLPATAPVVSGQESSS